MTEPGGRRGGEEGEGERGNGPDGVVGEVRVQRIPLAES